MSNDQLPSINDFTEDLSELPSADEFIKEDLPSVEEFVEKQEEDIVEETIEEPVEAEDLTEVIRLINDVRRDIPNIPEIKYYDEELEKLSAYVEQIKESIPEIPEIKEYDREVEAICEQIDLVREEIKDLPEVKYYDEQIKSIEHKLDLTNQNIDELPEPEVYLTDLKKIREEVERVRSEIPIFPKWVNEVNEVPDFTWIGKTFSVIDDDFIKLNDHILDLKTKFDSDIDTLSESLDTKDFERRGEVNKIREDLKETKDKIYEELKETAIKIWEHKDQFKDDDRRLKKSILSKLNEAKQKIEQQITESYNKNYESNKTLKTYFEGLKEEIANLPQPKYYDDPIRDLKKGLSKLDEKREEQGLNIIELYKIVEDLKGTQQHLTEIYNDRPLTPDPNLKQGNDPLTPTDQQFATLKDLAANYRLFVNRVEQQLYTIGGGGAGFVKDLDDVNIAGITTGDLLIYGGGTSGTHWVGIASTALGSSSVGAAGTWTTDSVGIHTTKSVGIGTTASSSYTLIVGGDIHATGNVSVAGTITYDDVKHVDSTGISTFQAGIIVDTVGVSVSAGIVTTPSLHVGAGIITASDSGINVTGVITATKLWIEGDARVTGILTVGSGSITFDPTKKEITGINNVIAGSGSSISLAPLLNLGGKFETDYSKLILSASGSTFDGTYERQSTGYYLGAGTIGAGSARFYQDDTNYYYFLHESDNAKIAIFSIVQGAWFVIYKGGTDFSSITNGQLLGGVTTYQYLTSARETYSDNDRVYPATRNGIEYLTSLTEQTSSLGIATATSLDVSGITTVATLKCGAGIITASNSGINVTGVITATKFVGDGSELTNLPGQKDLWSINATGIHTLSNAGVGTTSATHTLTVGAVGASGTSLFVHGDARIVGVLTVGSSSVTIDGNTNKVNVGTGITLDANTGEIFAPAMKSVGTTGAFYPPVLTTTQRDALTVTEGAMIFNTTSKKMEFYDGTTWQSLPGMSLGLTVALDG